MLCLVVPCRTLCSIADSIVTVVALFAELVLRPGGATGPLWNYATPSMEEKVDGAGQHLKGETTRTTFVDLWFHYCYLRLRNGFSQNGATVI